MASMGSGYDLSVATFSPDGRVFQVEYAAKAIEKTGLTLGAIFTDGILLAVDKYLPSPLMVDTSATRVFKLAPHAIAVVAGSLPDARQLVSRARLECSEYEKVWGVPISGCVLADRIGLFVHAHTAVWSTRPSGCAIIIGVAENLKPQPFAASSTVLPDKHDVSMKDPSPKDYSLWVIDPTGAAYKYRGSAIARGSPAAKSDLEKLNLDELTTTQGVAEFSKILHQHHQEIRERSMKVEMIWLTSANDNRGELVPSNILDVANTNAQEWLDRMD